MSDSTNTKVCSKCKKKLNISNFYKNRSCKDGLQNNCKKCQKYYSYTYYSNNKELILKKLKIKKGDAE